MGLIISRFSDEELLLVGLVLSDRSTKRILEIGVLRGSKVSKASTCCPTESKQIAQINFAPERRTQQREESGKGVIPAVTLHEIRRLWKKGSFAALNWETQPANCT